jgi:hypothetical protein
MLCKSDDDMIYNVKALAEHGGVRCSGGYLSAEHEEYEKSVHYFDPLFAHEEDHPNDTYHIAAEAWAALKNTDKMLTYLRAAAERGWKYPEYTRQIKEFSIVHSMCEWKAILERMEKNRKEDNDN